MGIYRVPPLYIDSQAGLRLGGPRGAFRPPNYPQAIAQRCEYGEKIE